MYRRMGPAELEKVIEEVKMDKLKKDSEGLRLDRRLNGQRSPLVRLNEQGATTLPSEDKSISTGFLEALPRDAASQLEPRS